MWKCPKCGREFARENQSHSCGEKPLTVDEYIARQPDGVRPELLQVRDALRAALPNAEERISWGMPTYWQGRNLIHFAANKHHIGLYPGAEAVAGRRRPYRAHRRVVPWRDGVSLATAGLASERTRMRMPVDTVGAGASSARPELRACPKFAVAGRFTRFRLVSPCRCHFPTCGSEKS